MWAGNSSLVLAVCLPENEGGTGAQRVSLPEVNRLFGYIRNKGCVCVCMCVCEASEYAKIIMKKERP